MRRLLVAAAFVVPAAAVVAAISTAPSGQVVDLDNYNTEETTSYINAAQCAGGTLNLQWSIVDFGGGLAGTGTYEIYAANRQTSAANPDGEEAFCPEDDAPNVTPIERAARVGSVTYTADIQGTTTEVTGLEAATAAGVDCDSDGGVVYICAHLYDGTSSTTRKGYARGQFVVQVQAPTAPAGVRAWPADDDALFVEWNENTSGVEVDRYRIVVTPQGGSAITKDVFAGTTETTISGLPVSTPCTIEVYAISLGGNLSQPTTIEATPGPVSDFWEWYGGQEKGGCGAGGTGPLSLAALGLLALLRRRA